MFVEALADWSKMKQKVSTKLYAATQRNDIQINVVNKNDIQNNDSQNNNIHNSSIQNIKSE